MFYCGRQEAESHRSMSLTDKTDVRISISDPQEVILRPVSQFETGSPLVTSSSTVMSWIRWRNWLFPICLRTYLSSDSDLASSLFLVCLNTIHYVFCRLPKHRASLNQATTGLSALERDQDCRLKSSLLVAIAVTSRRP